MAKITLDTITSSFASTSLFNTNFTAIKDELNNKVLYRDNPTGEANQMLNALDMNSNDVLNARLVAADAFNVGGTLLTPSTSLETLTYLDTEFTNVAGEDTFTVSYTPSFADVYYNGVLLADADATTTSGTQVVLTTPVVSDDDVITIRSYSAFSAGDGITQSDADMRYLQANNNLNDLQDVPTAQTNLGVADSLAAGSNYGKNLIINGDFPVWQRGTSTTTDNAFQADRFFMVLSGATGTYSRQSHTLGQTDVPGNPKYFTRLAMSAGNNNAGLVHRIEDVTATAGREVTLSFYAKGTNPAGGSFEILPTQDFGTGGSPSSAVDNTTLTGVTVTSSWQRFTYTFTPDSITGKTLGTNNDNRLQLYFRQPNTDTSTDAWTLDISNVQLEFGDTATEFEYVHPADQLARCQRYYVRYDGTVGGVGTTFQTNSGRTVHSFPVAMRASPSLSISDVADFDYFANNTITNGATTVALAGGTKTSAELTHITTLTINVPFFFRVPSGWFAFDAEL